jgi:hypothetical protein
MSRRSTSFSGQFAGRLIEMLESPAFRVLSLSAHRVINRVEIEHAHHGGKDNGALPVTFDDFQRYGIHRHAVAPAIREAVALGFLEITQQGRAGNADWRKPNLFRLTYRPAKGVYGDGTHEWRKIETPEAALMLADVARKSKSKQPRTQCRKKTDFTPEKRTTKYPFHGAKTGITGDSAETITTSISRVGGMIQPSGGNRR